MANDEPQSAYSEENVQYIDPREHIRRHPETYIGGTGRRALHHMLLELAYWSVLEAVAGRCSAITITLLADDWVEVQDNGVGLPMRPYDDTGLTIMEAVLQFVYAGVEREADEPNHYIFSTGDGVHNVMQPGIVAALCDELLVENIRDAVLYRQRYAAGFPQTALVREEGRSEYIGNGTIYRFHPDFTLLEPNPFDVYLIAGRAREYAFLVPGLRVDVIDARGDKKFAQSFQYEDGLLGRLLELTPSLEPLHAPIHVHGSHRDPNSDEAINFEMAFQFTRSDQSMVEGLHDFQHSLPDCVHLTAFRVALLQCLNALIEQDETLDVELLSWDEASTGLYALVSAMHSDLPTRNAVSNCPMNPDLFEAMAKAVTEACNNPLTDEEDDWRVVVVQHLLARR